MPEAHKHSVVSFQATHEIGHLDLDLAFLKIGGLSSDGDMPVIINEAQPSIKKDIRYITFVR